MRRLLLSLVAVLLLVLPWVILDSLDAWMIEERAGADLRAWEGRARQVTGQIQASHAIERQCERQADRFRERLGSLLTHLGRRGLAPELVIRAAREIFSHDRSAPAMYLFRPGPDRAGKWQAVKGKGLGTVAAPLLGTVVGALVRGSRQEAVPAEAGRTFRGLFGDLLTIDQLARQGIGRVYAATFRGKDVWLYWNVLRPGRKPAGVLLLLFPRRIDLSPEEELGRFLRNWRARSGFPLFLRTFQAPGSRELLAHPRLAALPAFRGLAPALIRQIRGLPPGRAGRFGDWWLLRQGLSGDRPYDVCLVRPIPVRGPTLAGRGRAWYGGGMALALTLGLGWCLRAGALPSPTLRRSFVMLLLLLAGLPLFGCLVFGAGQAGGWLALSLRQATEEVDAFYQRLDAVGEHRKAQYRRIVDRDLPAWKSMVPGVNGGSHLDRLAGAFREAGLPLMGILVFDRAGGILSRLSDSLAPAAVQSLIDYFQDWAVGGFSEISGPAGGPGWLQSQRTQMFQHLARTLNPDRGLAAMIMWQLGMAEAVVLEDTRFYNLHTAVVRDGTLQAFINILWRGDADFRGILREAVARRNAGSPAHTCAVVAAEQGALVPVVPPASSVFWRTPAGRAMWEVFEGFRFRRAAFAGVRGGFHLTVAPSVTAPGLLFGGVAPLEPFQAEARRRQFLLVALLSLLTVGVAGTGLLIVRRFIDPIRRLEEALWAVCHGDLGQTLELSGAREFAEVSATFQDMVDGLRERRNLGRFVSGALAGGGLAGGSLAGGSLAGGSLAGGGFGGDGRAGGGGLPGVGLAAPAGRRHSVRRRGTVLVSDIRRFTTLSERHPVDQVVSMLNRHLDALAREVHARGGFVDKFIGDAMVAVFFAEEAAGVPGPSVPGQAAGVVAALDAAGPSHVRRAMAAAWAMRQTGLAIVAEREAAGQFSYEFGIGLATGELVSLTIGLALERSEHQVLGFPVQRAEVLEGLSKQATRTRIVVDRSVVSACPEFAFAALPFVETWEVTGPADPGGPGPGRGASSAPEPAGPAAPGQASAPGMRGEDDR
ncbi:MAG: adenylate/guanylate cyclase domain-containing protein [Candidatus Riflebacteria bacterium]|nr:adenylate/guanylate cyclase domain-containing protein [Candidatus Riflebacteria bacterium]